MRQSCGLRQEPAPASSSPQRESTAPRRSAKKLTVGRRQELDWRRVSTASGSERFFRNGLIYCASLATARGTDSADALRIPDLGAAGQIEGSGCDLQRSEE